MFVILVLSLFHSFICFQLLNSLCGLLRIFFAFCDCGVMNYHIAIWLELNYSVFLERGT